MMGTLVDALGHEPGYLNVVLDLMLRRGIVDPTAAADWATGSSALQGLLNSYWSHAHVNVVVDRAIDIARAAIAHRRELGGDMVLDETATLSLLASTGGGGDPRRAARPAMARDDPVEEEANRAGADGDGDGDENADDEDGESAPKRRRNRDDEADGDADAAVGAGAGGAMDADDDEVIYHS
jgi:hypothetical protein